MPNRFLRDEDERRNALLEETGTDPDMLVQATDPENLAAQLAAQHAGGVPDNVDAGPEPEPEVGGDDVSPAPPDVVDAGAEPVPEPMGAAPAQANSRDAMLRHIMGRLAKSKPNPAQEAANAVSQGLYHAGTRTPLPETFFQPSRQDELTEALRWAQLLKATKPDAPKGADPLKPEYDPDSDYSKSRTEFMRYADPEAVAALEKAGVRPTGKTFDAAAINLNERKATREGNEAHKAAQLEATNAYRQAVLAQRARSYQLQLDKFADKLGKDELMAVRVGAEKTNKLVDGVVALKNLWAELPGGLENADKFLQDVVGNGAASRFLDNDGEARLRQAYDILASDKRHEWFGAALSDTEQQIANGLFGQGKGAPPEQMAYAIDWLRKSLKGRVGAAQAELSQYPNGLALVGQMTGVRFDDPVFGAVQPPINSGQGLIPGALEGTVTGAARKAVQIPGAIEDTAKSIGRKIEQIGAPTPKRVQPTPQVAPPAAQMSDKDRAALNWAKSPANANDPRAIKIRADIKAKFGVE